MSYTDTIYALATAPGKSGVAVVRVSGPDAHLALEKLSNSPLPAPNYAQLMMLSHPKSGALIDHALVLLFGTPKSFTGEDVVEFHIHGSRAVIQSLYSALATIEGLRIAEPGEFSRRALFNDKMDLLEVEALADLIEADTTMQQTQALAQMQGKMGKQFELLRSQIVEALALMEAYIDFPDEEIPSSVLADVTARIDETKATIKGLLKDDRLGERIREGFRLVILGAPNVGKSTLLNQLAGRDVAITSDIAGTTRDVIEVQLDIGGFPVILADTAGIRQGTEEIEKIGIGKAFSCASEADLKLLMIENEYDLEALGKNDLADGDALIIYNKCDLEALDSTSSSIGISALTGEGIDELLQAIEKKLQQKQSSTPSPLITRARHRECLKSAMDDLSTLSMSAALEITCEQLRLAANNIGKITGKIVTDELLDLIFSRFCIGK